MFSDSAPHYWNLYCHIGGGNGTTLGKIHGLGCRVSSSHILTAAHVFREYEWPAVLLNDGFWKCIVVKSWPELDIALLRKSSLVEPKGEPEIKLVYPPLSSRIPPLGTSLGYIGWLSLLDNNGQTKGRTYFGQGPVAFLETKDTGQRRIAVAGSAVQHGFSGGPVFTSDGALSGVLVEALQYMSNLPHPSPEMKSLALVSPIAAIHHELSPLLQDA